MEMNYRHLGRTGIVVSEFSLGSWATFGAQDDSSIAEACLSKARELGVNFFDTAEAYDDGAAERVFASVFKKLGWRRSDLVVSTKIFWGGDRKLNNIGVSRKHLMEGTWASLERLEMPYVDVLYCHRPDEKTPIEETVRAMNDLIRNNKTFYWGTSEWSAQQIMEAWQVADRLGLIGPIVEQPQYNMFSRERVEKEYRRLYTQVGLGTTIWSPLASGILTGKYANGVPKGSRFDQPNYQWLREILIDSERGQANIKKVTQLQPIAEELGCTTAQLALAWCLRPQFPHVSTVLTGATSLAQVEENFKAREFIAKLDDDVVERIEKVLDNAPEMPQQFRK